MSESVSAPAAPAAGTEGAAPAASPGTLFGTAGEKAPVEEVVKSPAELEAEAATAAKATADADKAAADKAAAEKAAAVPEKYEFKPTDGQTLDPAALEAFTPIAKELGLTQDQAQKLVDLQTKLVARQQENYVKTIGEWRTQTEADKEFGGTALKENTGLAVKALDKFGTPALRQALDDSGMGNHPEIFRLLWKIGKAASEDTFSMGNKGGGNSANKSYADIMYPNLPSAR